MMPTYEYETPDGVRHERVFMLDEQRPEVIMIDGQEARRLYTVSAIRFKGAFSGGTSQRHQVHPETATISEMNKHASGRKKEREQREDAARRKIVGDMVSTYNL